MNNSFILDEELKKLIENNPEKAWERIISSYYQDSYCSYIYTIIRNIISKYINSEDPLFNDYIGDCFVTILEKLKDNDYKALRDFHGKSSFKTYLATIVRNNTIDVIRKLTSRKRKPPTPIKSIEAGERSKEGDLEPIEVLDERFTPDPEKITIKEKSNEELNQIVIELQKLIKELSSLEQNVLRLWFEEEKKGPEIAEILRISDYREVYRIKEKICRVLKEKLEKKGINKNCLRKITEIYNNNE